MGKVPIQATPHRANLRQEISFVVQENQLEKACSVFSRSGLQMCEDNECSLRLPHTSPNLAWQTVPHIPWDRDMRHPHAHFHLHPENSATDAKDRCSIRLFTKENCLWELKGFERGPSFTDGWNQNIIYASDENLPPEAKAGDIGNCRFPQALPPVRIPTPQRALEAFFLLRLSSKHMLTCGYWDSMIIYMLLYVVDKGWMKLDLVDPAFLEPISALSKGNYKRITPLSEQLFGQRARMRQ
jgi:hypothetical protein